MGLIVAKAARTSKASGEIKDKIHSALDIALEHAEDDFAAGTPPGYGLSSRLEDSLEKLSMSSSSASTGFTNIVTSLAIKAALGEMVDIRYHQVQIQDQTDRPAGFNFRGVSEDTVYPWLAEHGFEGAKSGWQTRTLERPKPYILPYDENIAIIHEPFFACYDEIEVHEANALDALSFLIYRQLELREKKTIPIATPASKDILLIVLLFEKHFFNKYKTKGASRLPVLALHAIYSLMVVELERFKGKKLKPLELHSAADAQTGAIGDIEVVEQDDKTIYEAVEVKHGIEIDAAIIENVKLKIMDKSVDRYYVLTTHHNCTASPENSVELGRIRDRFQCQVIVNGVMASIKYYLRMLADPSKVFSRYAQLLQNDKAIGHEHREAWNKVVTGDI